MLGSTPFGQKPANTATATGFGTGLTQPTSFGSPSAFSTPQQQPTFGTPQQQPSFGTPQQQPSFGTPQQQPSFGTPQQQPTFGTPQQQPTFGTPQQQPTFGQAASTPTFNQGTPSAFGQVPGSTTTGFGPAAVLGTTQTSFGTPTTTQGFGGAAPSFGSTTTPLSFGANQQKPGFGVAAQPLSFGTPTAPAPAPAMQPAGFSFGSNLGQSGFGANQTANTSFSLGTTPTTQSSLTFNQPQTTTALNFGTSKPGTVSFGTTLPAAATTAQPSLTFGSSLISKPTTATTLGTTGFNFGSASTAQTAAASPTVTPSLGPGLGASSGMCFGLTSTGGKSMLTITGNTATPLYSTKSTDLNAGRSQGQVVPKCQHIPPVLLELVESLKNHMKDQKHLCLEVSRASLKPISKITNDIENIKKSVMKLDRAVNKNKILNSKLKEETIKALADLEIAQKAMDYPGGFPCDNSIVTDYFLQLAIKFQAQVVALRIELESTEKNILCELNPVAFTPQELSTTMQRLYECFVALAGKFQFVHAQISNLKVHHLELRKKKMEDYIDIFNKKNSVMKPTSETISLAAGGPSPFSDFPSYHSLNMIASRSKQQSDSTPTLSTTALAHSLFNANSPFNQIPLQNTSLLSTPTSTVPGSKRGKR